MSKQAKRVISLMIVLVLAVGLAGAYFWSASREAEDMAEDTPFTPAELFTLADRCQSEIARVSVTHNGETRTFARAEAVMDRFNWYLTDYPDLQLDNLHVQDLLRPVFQMSTRDRAHENIAGLNLAEFGFNPPQVTITAYLENGGISAIHLGYETPDRRHYFVRVEDDPAMYLLPRHVAQRMFLTTEELLHRFIPPFNHETIHRLRITQRGRETLEIAKTDESAMIEALTELGVNPLAIVQPNAIAGREVDVFNLNMHVLEAFSAAFRLGDVVEMFPADLAPFGLDDPFLDFYFHAEEGVTHLLFGNRFTREAGGAQVPLIYVKVADRPHVFMAVFNPVENLMDINVTQLITRFIALTPILEVERVTAGDFELVVNHDPAENSTAIFPTVNGVTVPEQPFRVLYRMLIALGADALIDPAPPTGMAEFSVIYHMLDGTQTTIDFFAYDDNFYTFSLNGEYVWAVTNRRGVEMFFNEAARLFEVHG
ncbi:MAG: DUF4340 domain-containing protein [Defluviitaleaceae bacterium]|nr:DUF4340 domain-containing protein [Defluviitaleaceae bacterium]MCL2275049.1 DUF4340 domain-containing protein [Defluviitaleaceae bacterium]